MDDGSIFMIVALIILIGLSAFFSAAETAYNSLNEIRLRSKAEDGDAKAAHTLALVERYDSLLSTILIGNNIVNIGASSLATVLFTRLVGGVYGPTVSTIVMTLLVCEGLYAASDLADLLLPEEEDDLLVREKVIDVTPMTEEQALVQTDLLGHDFYVFENATTGLINVVYHRKNGGYGIIKPRIETLDE